jgi:hypothetical protein
MGNVVVGAAGADGGAAAPVNLFVPNATPMLWKPCRCWPIRSMVLHPWGEHARYGTLRHWPIANQKAELLRLARDEHGMDEGACPLSPVGVGSHVTY